MKSDVFRFKKFDVCQRRSAMKVGMDGVTLGAWALPDVSEDANITVWDIGTGTGLISLMIAQRFANAKIYAIEVDPDAAAEAEFNFANSDFCNSLHILTGDVLNMADMMPEPDAIICNPPYFRNALPAPESSRNTARHEGNLCVESLISLSAERLKEGGFLNIILPSEAAQIVDFNASLSAMSVDRKVNLVSVEGKNPVRNLWQLVKGSSGRNLSETIIVKDRDGKYSEKYHNLTNIFYLDK